jgi:hypothetical protein
MALVVNLSIAALLLALVTTATFIATRRSPLDDAFGPMSRVEHDSTTLELGSQGGIRMNTGAFNERDHLIHNTHARVRRPVLHGVTFRGPTPS